MLELVFLAAGLLARAAAIADVLAQRTPAEHAQAAIRVGLLEPESRLDPPADLRPGMLGALIDGEVSDRDLKLTLLDLAARGYLTITPTTTASGRSTWQLDRTVKPIDATLLGYEHALLTRPFENGSVLLNQLARDPAKPLEQARTAVSEEVRAKGWFLTDAKSRHSRWGWIGALVLVLGLLATAFMLIDWAATNDFRGVIGGLGVVAAGVLLASKGRARSSHTPAGVTALTHAEQLKSALHDLQPEEIAVVTAGAEFSRLLPWAIGFGAETKLATAVDDELQRAAKWGQHVELQLSWLTSEAGHQVDGDARKIATEVATVVNRKTNGRGHAQRVATPA